MISTHSYPDPQIRLKLNLLERARALILNKEMVRINNNPIKIKMNSRGRIMLIITLRWGELQVFMILYLLGSDIDHL